MRWVASTYHPSNQKPNTTLRSASSLTVFPASRASHPAPRIPRLPTHQTTDAIDGFVCGVTMPATLPRHGDHVCYIAPAG
ncbi:MAG: hypothetical protein SFX18_04150 [Pirellulales bacterium]|nr:hypothetical protein [Pirellulales bacterium]